MMKTYSHIRRQALNQAAAALEPSSTTTPAPSDATRLSTQPRRHAKPGYVTVHVTIGPRPGQLPMCPERT